MIPFNYQNTALLTSNQHYYILVAPVTTFLTLIMTINKPTHIIQRKRIGGIQAYLIILRINQHYNYYYHLAYKERPMGVCSLLNSERNLRELFVEEGGKYIPCSERIILQSWEGDTLKVIRGTVDRSIFKRDFDIKIVPQ